MYGVMKVFEEASKGGGPPEIYEHASQAGEPERVR